MKFLVRATMPHETFNKYVRDGSAGEKLNKVLEATKPEAVYFTDSDGKRSAVMVIEMADASKIPAIAEPWFLTFNADLDFKACMTPADLKNSGLDKIGKQWT